MNSENTIPDEHFSHLESVNSNEKRKGTVSTFKTDELSAVCPFDFGGPDFYDLTIRYEDDAEYVESKSLKKFIESYRDREITAEDLAEEIYDSIDLRISPHKLYIRLEQQRRGGIEETVEVGDSSLGYEQSD